MKQIIRIEDDIVFIGTETSEIVNTSINNVNYKNPQVGDFVEIFQNGDTIIVIKSENTGTEYKIKSQKKIKKNKALDSKYLTGKRKWIALSAAVLIVLLTVGIVSCLCKQTYDWPDSKTANMLPKPEGKITFISESDGEYLDATVKIKDGYCKTYIDACIEKGFDIDTEMSNYEGEYDYSAKNNIGWEVNVYNFGKEMNISLYSPEWLSDDLDDLDDSEQVEDKENNTTKELVNGMRPEFKEAMDSYEEFYDEYCDLMVEYAEDPTNLTLITKYNELASKIIEVDEKFEKWNEGDMNDAELQYYLEVSARVSEKLANVATTL